MTVSVPVTRVRVVLPGPLKALLNVSGELSLDALEHRYPTLRGTIRDHGTHKRRAFVRFYACERDLSLQSPDELLPASVRDGHEPLLIVGAMAGG